MYTIIRGESCQYCTQQQSTITNLKNELQIIQGEKRTFQREIEQIKQDNDRLIQENVNKVRDKYDIMEKEYIKIKKQLEDYLAERNEKENNNSMTLKDPTLINASTIGITVEGELETVLRIKNQFDYKGMFAFPRNDHFVGIIMKTLVYEYSPKMAKTLSPELPAYILFMCIRHANFTPHEEIMYNILDSYVKSVKEIMEQKNLEFEKVVLLFANTFRLLQMLKQYEDEFQNCNKIPDYYEILSDLVISVYQSLINLMQVRVQWISSLAILETIEEPVPLNEGLGELEHILTEYYDLLTLMNNDKRIILQIFRQLFYSICAKALNSLLIRKKYWPSGTLLYHNLFHLESWIRYCSLNISSDYDVLEQMQPLMQAAKLLQALQLDKNVLNICATCSKMSYSQIKQLIDSYKPDECEEILSILSFNMEEKESEISEQSSFQMDVEKFFPLEIPSCPSNIKLEDVVIPDALNLPMLEKI